MNEKRGTGGGQIRATFSRSFFIRAMINRAYPLHPVINGTAPAIQLISVALFAVEKRSRLSCPPSHFVACPSNHRPAVNRFKRRPSVFRPCKVIFVPLGRRNGREGNAVTGDASLVHDGFLLLFFIYCLFIKCKMINYISFKIDRVSGSNSITITIIIYLLH